LAFYMNTFKALQINQPVSSQNPEVLIQKVKKESLPEGEVLIEVAYSSLNYKDGLAVTGQGKVIRQFPMVPGIDLAGIVREDISCRFKPGELVVLTGWGVGEHHWGGYAQWARVKADWLVPLPDGFTLKQAMGIGTAGLTAMLCVMALEEQGLQPGSREVIVTGASGGVGSIATVLLAHLGYAVVASTGKIEAHDYLRSLGARDILDRSELATLQKPLKLERWGGAIDTVGGQILASLLSSMAYGTSVAACGLAFDSNLNTTVLPFILRGVRLIGIDSVMCPMARRQIAWSRLARDLCLERLEKMLRVISLEEVPAMSQAILKGQVRGRIVVDLNT
jgi:acrylyl-CoA reductase (NADPH)